MIAITSTDAGTTGALMEFYQNSDTPADNDVLGRINFYGQDDSVNKVLYASIKGQARDVTLAGSELDGKITFAVNVFGTVTDALTLYSSR